MMESRKWGCAAMIMFGAMLIAELAGWSPDWTHGLLLFAMMLCTAAIIKELEGRR